MLRKIILPSGFALCLSSRESVLALVRVDVPVGDPRLGQAVSATGIHFTSGTVAIVPDAVPAVYDAIAAADFGNGSSLRGTRN